MSCEQYLTKLKNKKKQIAAFIVCIFTLYVFCLLLWHNFDKIRYVFDNDEYIYKSVNAENYMEVNDCILKNGEMIITGDDPYVVYKLDPMWVWDVSPEMFKDYGGTYQVFYALQEGFSESKVAKFYNTDSKPELRVGKYIDKLRIDFNDIVVGDVYKIVEDDDSAIIINANEKIDFWSHNIKEIFIITICYILISGVTLYLVLVRDKLQIKCPYSIIYIVLITNVWMQILSINYKWHIFLAFSMAIMGSVFFVISFFSEDEKRCCL